jgi:hypothetical protein
MIVLHAMVKNTIPFITTSLALYAIDLVLRFIFSYLRPATIKEVTYLEECNTVKLQIHKPGFTYEPGQYVFLWIDAVGWAKSQPFTIATHSEPSKQNTVTIYFKNMCHHLQSVAW